MGKLTCLGARSWSSAPLCTLVYRQDLAAVFTALPGEGVVYQLKELISSWALSLPGKPVEDQDPHLAADENSSWGLRASYRRKISCSCRTEEIKAGTVRQRGYTKNKQTVILNGLTLQNTIQLWVIELNTILGARVWSHGAFKGVM